MSRLRRRRLTGKGLKKVTYIMTMFTVYILLLMLAPSLINKDSDDGYYTVAVNGVVVGAVKNSGEAHNALLEARKQYAASVEGQPYADVEMSVKKEDKLFGAVTEKATLTTNIYNQIKESAITEETTVYVVDIDGKSVALSSLEEVEELLTIVKNQYDKDNLFKVQIGVNSDRANSYYCEVVMKEELKEDNELLNSAVGEGFTDDEEEEEAGVETKPEVDAAEEDGMKSISFCEDVKIVVSNSGKDKVLTLEEAVSEVTAEKDDNQIYEVVAGDSLYKVAKRFGLKLKELLEINSHIDEDDYLQIGDELTVKVAVPELSVEYKEQLSYNENYNLPVEYIYDDSKYNTYSKVEKKAVTGVRDVVAMVTYVNGKETEREIISEVVSKKAVAKVVRIGTKTPPTLVKPLTGGRISSRFGWRTLRGERDYHKGVDWAVPTGTAIRAAGTGTVISAGWNGSYGYCVIIQHADGKETRYAHLSKILVKKGEKVKQSQKIALSGNTGNSTGPHLHFEVRVNGTPVNPLKYV